MYDNVYECDLYNTLCIDRATTFMGIILNEIDNVLEVSVVLNILNH